MVAIVGWSPVSVVTVTGSSPIVIVPGRVGLAGLSSLSASVAAGVVAAR